MATKKQPAREHQPPQERGLKAANFYDTVNEWLDLNESLKKLTAQSPENKGRARGWGGLRGEAVAEDTAADMVSAIASGRAADLLTPREPAKKQEARVTAIKKQLATLDTRIQAYKKAGKFSDEVRAEFAFARTVKQVGEEMQALHTLRDQTDRHAFDIVRERRHRLGAEDALLLQESDRIRQALDQRDRQLELSAETGDAARLNTLLTYRAQLANRFAETPSRKKYIEEIRALWEQGKNVFLSGSTGTGKTEMLIHLGNTLYDTPPQVVACEEQTGPAEIFGKMLLRATKDGGTETYFQPGRYTAAIDEGVPVVFDEFNTLDPKMRIGLKAYYNRKPGDTVIIQQDTGKKHTIKYGFGFAATANIKSTKHGERFELDAAETRVFDFRTIEYQPKNEVYDLCIAKLLDDRGGLRLPKKHAGETLKQLVLAAEMVQAAYQGKKTGMYAEGGATKGKNAELEKALLDPGRVLSLLDGWPVAAARGDDFKDYLEKQLKHFINTEDYPEKDRKLLLQIFITKGFFSGYEPDAFAIPALEAKTLKAWGWREGRDEPAPADYLPPSAVALLDPFEIRKRQLKEVGDEFLARAASSEHERLLAQVPGLTAADLKAFGALFEGLEGKSADRITAALTAEHRAPAAARRAAFEQHGAVNDGYTFDQHTGEATLDIEQNHAYWQKFWSDMGITYTPTGAPDAARTTELLEKGMDWFVGIPDISTQQLKDICAKAKLKIYNPEFLDLPALNRSALPTADYLLATKVAQNIATHNSEKDPLYSTQDIDFSAAQKLADAHDLRGLTYKEYLILQLIYFKQTKKHLDESSWTWFLDQKAPDSGQAASGGFGGGGVGLYQGDPSGRNDGGGVRLSDVLPLKPGA